MLLVVVDFMELAGFMSLGEKSILEMFLSNLTQISYFSDRQREIDSSKLFQFGNYYICTFFQT